MSSVLCDIKTISDELLCQIKKYEDYYGAWQKLKSVLNQYDAQICVAQDFFSVTFDALLNSMMFELIKLYDRHKDALSVKKLLNKCQTEKEYVFAFLNTPIKNALYKNAITSFCSFLNDKKTINSLDNLITRRDRYYMHKNGKRIQIDEMVNQYPFSFECAEQLILEAKKFCSILYQLATDTEWDPMVSDVAQSKHIRDFSGLETILKSV